MHTQARSVLTLYFPPSKPRLALTADLPNNSILLPQRYLILTYVAEFDRVHYPLPLAFDDHPDPEHLKGIIRRLREQLEVSRTALGPRAARVTEVVAEVRRLREENAGLKAALRRLEQDRSLEAQVGTRCLLLMQF